MIVLPRLARESATSTPRLSPDFGHGRSWLRQCPTTVQAVTYTPVGGNRIADDDLSALREEILSLAREYGMPDTFRTLRNSKADGPAVRERLDITPNEASHEEVWSYLTCCWLLDVAVWRFGAQADRRRFIGNVNRNTFRRLWWRAEVLGPDIDLTQLGEDELVNIMERPTIAADLRLARAVAREFLSRVDRGAADSRMQLMREAMKRLLRLTPLISFAALGRPRPAVSGRGNLRRCGRRTFGQALSSGGAPPCRRHASARARTYRAQPQRGRSAE